MLDAVSCLRPLSPRSFLRCSQNVLLQQRKLRHWYWCLSTPRTQKERTRGPAVLAPELAVTYPATMQTYQQDPSGSRSA